MAGDASVRDWRTAHEKEIVAEFLALLALPNVATNVRVIERNAAFISEALQPRGFNTQVISAGAGTPPAVFGELRTPGAKRTVVFYAHYDGQPVSQRDWRSGPFNPVVRAGPRADPGHDVFLVLNQGWDYEQNRFTNSNREVTIKAAATVRF